jgi:hypothetical protein
MRTVLAGLVLLIATAASADPGFWKHEFPLTDFSRSSVAWTEIMSGGPARDGIPAIMEPRFHEVVYEESLAPREPVITLEIEGEVPRAYPIRYLIWHEIVNDHVGEVPVAVTFCPLCNSALVFDRRLDGVELSFGVSGKLRMSDMIMYDHQTESWWQQATATGLVGAHMGRELVQLASWMESWDDFASRNPGGLVMSRPEHSRDYGRNPYVKYDSSERPFLFSGEMPPHDIAPLERVVRVGNRAWPLTRLAAVGEIVQGGVTLIWAPGQASALDVARIGDSRDVGSIRVRDGAGGDLPHDVMFAFAFHAFFPQGEWMLAE